MQQNVQLLNRTFFSYSSKQAVCSRCLGSSRIDEAKSFYTVTALDARTDKFSYGYTMEMNYFMAII